VLKRTAHLANRWKLPTAALRFLEFHDPQWIIGADEVGYGALAGPYAVGSFIAPIEWGMEGVKDSKKFSTSSAREKVRDRLAVEPSTAYRIVYASNERIDSEGRVPVLESIFAAAVNGLLSYTGLDPTREVLILLDGEVRVPFTHFSMAKADVHVPVVSAASILAKCARDTWMCNNHVDWPQYEWNDNKGYGTPAHLRALQQHGPSPLHRRSYEPVKSMTLRGDMGQRGALAVEPLTATLQEHHAFRKP